MGPSELGLGDEAPAEALIRARRAAARPKDLEVIAELEALLEESKPNR
jgi:hypothetical protein